MNDLAAILVHCDLWEVLDNWLKDNSAAFFSLHKPEALLEDVIPTNVADECENLPFGESFVD